MNTKDTKSQDKILQVMNEKVYNSEKRYLKDIEEKVLLGSLKRQKYKEIAQDYGYCTEYISQDIGFNLWRILTKALGESVNKNNIQGVSRRAVKNSNFNTIDNN